MREQRADVAALLVEPPHRGLFAIVPQQRQCVWRQKVIDHYQRRTAGKVMLFDLAVSLPPSARPLNAVSGL